MPALLNQPRSRATDGSLTSDDLDQITAALEPMIDQAVKEAIDAEIARRREQKTNATLNRLRNMQDQIDVDTYTARSDGSAAPSQDDPMTTMTEDQRKRYSKQAMNNVLHARDRGETMEFKAEYDRISGKREESALQYHKVPRSRRDRAYDIAKLREFKLRGQGQPADIGLLTDQVERELAEADGEPMPVRYEKSPPPNGMPSPYVRYIDRARIIGQKRYDEKHARGQATTLNQEIHAVLDELFTDVAARANGKPSDLYNNGDPNAYTIEELRSVAGSISEEASAMAVARVQRARNEGKSLEYKDALRDCVDELREKACRESPQRWGVAS